MIKDCSLVISNFSSVCVESLAYAVPVIIIDNSRNIDLNPIPNDIDNCIWGQCSTKKEFETEFKLKYFQGNKENYEKAAFYIRENYFTAISDSTMSNLLMI